MAVFIMMGFLGIGLVAYFFNLRKVILVSFACSGILCVFLKSASTSNLKLPEVNNETKVSVAHVNVSSAEDSYEAFTHELLQRDLDIISIQEVKPDWSRFLSKELQKEYPYHIENVRIDPFGMAIYSKYPILEVDTIFYNNIPFLISKVEIDQDKIVTIMNAMILPSINNALDKTQDAQLKFAANYLASNEGTELVIGDFNMVYWSSRIRDFRNMTDLKNSRRDVSQSVLSIPYDHIFHSPDIECTFFKDMIDSSGHRLGIYANFQFQNSKNIEL